MKQIIILSLMFILPNMVNCQKKDLTKWTEKQKVEWFNSSKWSNDLRMKPDSSINIQLFVEQNILNPKSWEVAFKFLKRNDLADMPVGKYQLLNDGTYATVSDYFTKDADTAFFEAHRKFIDVQYVAIGQEYIGITSLNNIEKQIQSYDVDKDIEFFTKAKTTLWLADQRCFFVFFPSDAHKPCLKVNKNEHVRKIVIKIPKK